MQPVGDSIALNVSGIAPVFIGRSFEEKVKAARNFGVNSVELHPYKEWGRFADLSSDELDRARESVGCLDRISVHAPMGETFATLDGPKSQEALEADKECIQAAGYLGAEVAVVHVGMRYVKTNTHKRRVADMISELGDSGESLGVRVAVETLTDLRHPEELVDLIRSVDHSNVGVTIDTGHLLGCLSAEDRRAKSIADRYNAVLHKTVDLFNTDMKVYHIHMNDIRASTLLDHYGAGLGFVDFQGVIEKMVGVGYGGMYALEMHRGRADHVSSITNAELQAAVDLTRSLIEDQD